MLVLKLATKANTKVVSEKSKEKLKERFANWPDLTFSGKTGNFKLKPTVFESTGLNTAAKSVNYAIADNVVYFCAVEGNTGISLKASDKGEKGNIFKSATLLEYLQEVGLIPAEVTEDFKAGFSLTQITEEVDGVLEAYTLAPKAFPTKEDSKGDDVIADSEEIDEVVDNEAIAPLEEVLDTTDNVEGDGFGDDI